jgi:GNAT superfamily N-acetyltransferase
VSASILRDLSPANLATAIEENFSAWFASFGRAPGTVDRSDAHRVSILGNPGYSVVCRARFAPEEVATRVAETVAPYRSLARPMLWWTGPTTRPPDLGRYLEAQGLRMVEACPGMALDLQMLDAGPPAPSGLTVTMIRDSATLQRFADAQAIEQGLAESASAAWREMLASVVLGEDAPSRLYVGWLGDEPVGSSWIFLGGGVAGIHNVLTTPRLRRQGIGTVLTTAPLHDARALGYRAGVLVASPLGLGIYRRLGFREFCTLHLHAWDGVAGGAAGAEGDNRSLL